MENRPSSPQEPYPQPDPEPQPEREPEPLSKKLKMSTTSTTASDEDGCALPSTTEPTAEKKPKYKRRKIAIFFAYCGAGYQGMQKNPGAKTIEGDLEEALYRSGAVPEWDRGCPKRFDWARSARTDKGVSAVGQVVSGRFYVDPPGLVHRLNSFLPTQIRIFGYKRVTPSFNAKKFCDRRRYLYLLPVFALDPSSHRDRESVMASVGSENELVKCLECSDRGRKVMGVKGKQVSDRSVGSSISSDSGAAPSDSIIMEDCKVSTETGDHLPPESGNETEVMESNGDFTSVSQTQVGINLMEGEAELKLDSCEEGMQKPAMADRFSYGDEERGRFNRILKSYEGTHNFHNFTTRTKAADPSARRFIVSFDASTIVNLEGMEFIKCEVVGQSFMLHQIRKMVGLAVAVMRNFAPESIIESALQQDLNINVPTAPEVGLFLDECMFTSYNNKWNESHEELCLKFYEEEAEEFKMKHIHPHIASMETKEGAVGLWLHSLNSRNYPDLCGGDGVACDGQTGTNGAGKTGKINDLAE